MRETTVNRGQGATNFMKDVSMLILALEKLGVHIIFARIVAQLCIFTAHVGKTTQQQHN
jgi:hypothetical protein